jgi:hypothetical protein
LGLGFDRLSPNGVRIPIILSLSKGPELVEGNSISGPWLRQAQPERWGGGLGFDKLSPNG